MIEFILDYYKKKNPMHHQFLLKRVEELHQFPMIKEHLLNYIESLIKDNASYEEIVQAYDSIMNMQFKEEIYFKRHKRYRYSTFAETHKFVYSNEEYMKKYMVGLGISNMLWPIHWQLFDFFKTQLQALPQGENYLEIGMGHGLHFLEAMKSKHYEHYLGVDISKACVELTQKLVQNANLDGEYQLLCKDIFDLKTDQLFDFIVFGEVLEHIENPALFLKTIKKYLKKDGYAYMSTCVNSPAIDHIFLFKTIEEIRQLVSLCGFEMLHETIIEEKNEQSASYAAIIKIQSD